MLAGHSGFRLIDPLLNHGALLRIVWGREGVRRQRGGRHRNAATNVHEVVVPNAGHWLLGGSARCDDRRAAGLPLSALSPGHSFAQAAAPF